MVVDTRILYVGVHVQEALGLGGSWLLRAGARYRLRSANPMPRGPMLIRHAQFDDWPAIWPFVHDIITAGDAYTWPGDIGEDGTHIMYRRL